MKNAQIHPLKNAKSLKYEAAVERQTGIRYLDAPNVKDDPGYCRRRRSIAAAMKHEEKSLDEFERDPIIDDVL